MEIRSHIIRNFLARLSFIGSTFLVNLVFARVLGAGSSGELYYTINNFSILALLTSFSLESGLTYFHSQKAIDEKQLITLSFIWALAAGVIATLLAAGLKGNFFSDTPYEVSGYSFLFISGTLLTTFISGLFYGRQHFLFPHLIPAAMNGMVLLVFVALYMFQQHIQTEILITVYFISIPVGGIILGILYHRIYSLRFSFSRISRSALVKLLQYSGLAFMANMVAFLVYRIDYWILKGFSPHIITDAALGNYIQVTKLVQIFLFAPSVIATIVFPVTAAGRQPGLKQDFRKIIFRLVIINLLACGFLLLAGQWIFVYVYGESFAMMYNCFVFSVPAILAITVVRVVASYFAGANRIRYNLIGSLLALVIITALNFLLIPSMGINGAALADSAGYTAYMVLLLFFLSRK
jgi:O-antigen/teichoic acid export membrane protein